MSIRCKLGFHDYWPLERPSALGFLSEAYSGCSRCDRREVIAMIFTDQLFYRWNKMGMQPSAVNAGVRALMTEIGDGGTKV